MGDNGLVAILTTLIQSPYGAAFQIIIGFGMVYLIAERVFTRYTEYKQARNNKALQERASASQQDSTWIQQVLDSNASYEQRLMALVEKIMVMNKEIDEEREEFRIKLEAQAKAFRNEINELKKFKVLFYKADFLLRKHIDGEPDYEGIVINPSMLEEKR